ncbi:MAG TPA: monofunctional biosynthetic peptidoglycan transglycosylase [Stellaceae bacterium]|nr:monofunctional biosynthetic peptidoglycan transglycosylase [Stellaceae bacterium]
MSEGSRARPAVAKSPPHRRVGRTLWSVVLAVLLLVLGLPIVVVAIYRLVPPPVIPLMLIRAVSGTPIRQHWIPLPQVSPWLVRAVIASEDARFCIHRGFDYEEIGAALERFRAGGRLRGASTISQQTAKNILLWPGGGFLRKGIEAYITELLELGWPKSRILEVYLNVIEWGDGVYGAEQAAQTHFRKPASALTRREAALLASILPNPRVLSVERPSRYIEERVATIEARMTQVEVPGTSSCR